VVFEKNVEIVHFQRIYMLEYWQANFVVMIIFS